VRSEIESLRNLLTSPGKVVILTHSRPDGDAIASLLSLCVCLDLAGYNVTGLLPDNVPRRYKYLPGLDLVTTHFPEDADLTIAVDCADEERIGLPSNTRPPKVDVNIDHHSSNSYFASLNIVQPKAPSTTFVIYELLVALGFPIKSAVAELLLTGLVTDTIGFRTENVTPEVLRLAAELQESGAPLAEIQLRALNQKNIAAIRYWGYGLNRIVQKNGVVWTNLLIKDREESGYSGLDDADLVNILSVIEGTRIAVILIEQPGGKVKISWRSSSGINVSKIAERFGGGGHDAAAGALIEGDMDEVTQAVLDATFSVVK
jgi:phosphoesterase RecJ-like protein